MNKNKFSDQSYLRNDQYKTDKNLGTRISLHQRYSINPVEWQSWVFDHAQIQKDTSILEVGCGRGDFWRENTEKLPSGLRPVLADFSLGMVNRASDLMGIGNYFRFTNLDIMALPFQNQVFDRVIANHMLYHVPDVDRGLSEVNRVIKPEGLFIAATNGENHMKEIFDLALNFYPEKKDLRKVTREFTLENGAALLRKWFKSVNLVLFEDALKVTEVEPIKNYILSMISIDIKKEDTQKLKRLLQAEIDRCGYFYIQKVSGVFIASQPFIS